MRTFRNCAIAAALAGVLALAACTTTGEIEGTRCVGRLSLSSCRPRMPTAFTPRRRRGSRRRGAGWEYCTGPSCARLKGNEHRSWKAVRYHHRARELCKTQVRENFPAVKPDCALYAVTDKIVWNGRMPWE